MTELIIILDRSGSMQTIAKPASDSVNEYINSQKNGPDKCNITVWEFDSIIEKQVERTPIEDCPVVKIVARGQTRLYDAIGMAINESNSRIKKARRKRPQVLFVIQTDGYENDSREFTRTSVKSLVEDCTKKGDQFIFLGANFMDAQAANLGVVKTSSIGFAQSNTGYAQTFSITSRETTNLRQAKVSGQSYSISMK